MRADLKTLHSLRDEHGTHGCCNSMPTHGNTPQKCTHMHAIRPKCSYSLRSFFYVASVTLIFKIYCLLLSITTEYHTLRLKKCAFSTVLHYTKLSPRVASRLENCTSSSNEEKLKISQSNRERIVIARSDTFIYICRFHECVCVCDVFCWTNLSPCNIFEY